MTPAWLSWSLVSPFSMCCTMPSIFSFCRTSSGNASFDMLGYLLVECDRVSEMWMLALLPLYGTSAVLDIYEVMTSKPTSKLSWGSLSTSADEREEFWLRSRAYFLTRNTRIHDISKLMLAGFLDPDLPAFCKSHMGLRGKLRGCAYGYVRSIGCDLPPQGLVS